MDKERILSNLDELESYLSEIEDIKPADLHEYKVSVEKRRACERLLQISIETVIDICNIIISELKLGLPSNEEEIFDKLEKKKIISPQMCGLLNDMKGFRNILVHKYGVVDDEIVFEMLSEKMKDFDAFKKEILLFLKTTDSQKTK